MSMAAVIFGLAGVALLAGGFLLVWPPTGFEGLSGFQGLLDLPGIAGVIVSLGLLEGS